jgi:hypothetical protein
MHRALDGDCRVVQSVRVTRVPLERQSTARIGLGVLGGAILPVAILACVLCYLMVQFVSTFVDVIDHAFPWFWL